MGAFIIRIALPGRLRALRVCALRVWGDLTWTLLVPSNMGKGTPHGRVEGGFR